MDINMTLKELLSVIDNRIFVEIYNSHGFRIMEDYSTTMLRYCDKKMLNKTVHKLSCDFDSTDADTDLQIFIED